MPTMTLYRNFLRLALTSANVNLASDALARLEDHAWPGNIRELGNLIERLVLLADRPLNRLRSVQAILRLEEGYGRERLEAACARALHFGDTRYRRIKEILRAGLDREPLAEEVELIPTHAHLFARSGTEFFDVATHHEEAATC